MLSTLHNLEDLGPELKSARARSHLTQKELADAVRCSLRTIQAIEAGTTIPRPALRRRLIAFFDKGAKAA